MSGNLYRHGELRGHWSEGGSRFHGAVDSLVAGEMSLLTSGFPSQWVVIAISILAWLQYRLTPKGGRRTGPALRGEYQSSSSDTTATKETGMAEETWRPQIVGRKFGLWRILAWLALACGLITYAVGWASAMAGAPVWNIPTQVWFYDAISAGVFAIFFLVYAADTDRRKTT